MARRERREVASRLVVLMAHLLKWRYQPECRGDSWRRTIQEQRARLTRRLAASSSLESYMLSIVEASYEKALVMAARETGLPADGLPQEMPFTVEDLMDPSFWPHEQA